MELTCVNIYCGSKIPVLTKSVLFSSWATFPKFPTVPFLE